MWSFLLYLIKTYPKKQSCYFIAPRKHLKHHLSAAVYVSSIRWSYLGLALECSTWLFPFLEQPLSRKARFSCMLLNLICSGGETPKGPSKRLSCADKRSVGDGPFVTMFSPSTIACTRFLNSWIVSFTASPSPVQDLVNYVILKGFEDGVCAFILYFTIVDLTLYEHKPPCIERMINFPNLRI
ncbi:hypothetical protein VNO77_44716 [Canavalia gladiata]|uniref:Uncharacterized protein n=1 Tax=Canavalia gladiata TaxID=3824 RepID=A0AAN9JWE5_CANGL